MKNHWLNSGKFYVGDRVKVVEDSELEALVGMVGTVVSQTYILPGAGAFGNEWKKVYFVKFDDDSEEWYFEFEELVRIDS